MGILKNQSELRSLNEAGRILETVLQAMAEAAQPGASTVALEALAVQLLQQNRSSAPFRAFNGFNHATCISLNEEIVNGPPSRERILAPGDLVSIATAAEHRGIHAKAAISFCVDTPPTPEHTRLLRGTAQAIQNAITLSQSASTLNEVLNAIPDTARQFNLTCLRSLGGSGIGKKLHDAPDVPNNPADLSETVLLQPGLCLTIMPMFCLGEADDFTQHPDGWTYVTENHTPAAHVADTLLFVDGAFTPITRLSAWSLERLPAVVSETA
jgi:methionyl aminopeptidase